MGQAKRRRVRAAVREDEVTGETLLRGRRRWFALERAAAAGGRAAGRNASRELDRHAFGT